MFGRNSIEQSHLACPCDVPGDGDQEQQRRIDRRVTRRLRNLIKMSELANPKFVEDFSRLFASPGIVFRSLPMRQRLGGMAAEIRIEREALNRRQQAVATEQADEPRHACSGESDAVLV